MKINTKMFLGLMFLGLLVPMGDTMAAPAADSLVVLHPHTTEFASSVIEGFKTWYSSQFSTTIDVQTTELFSGDAYDQVVEWNGTSPAADVWWGGGHFYFNDAHGKGLLEPHNVTEDANIPDTFGGWPMKDDSGDNAEHTWYAAAVSGFGIIYNKDYLTANSLSTPTKWEDLTKFEYFDHIAMTDPDLSGSTIAIVLQVLQHLSDATTAVNYTTDLTAAWEYWVKMSGNVQTFLSSSSKVPAAVQAGDAGIGLVIDYYAIDRMVNDTNLGFTYGGGTMVSPDPAGVLKGATNMVPAKRFMDYLMSTEGQSLVGDFRSPANSKATTASHVPKFMMADGSVDPTVAEVIDPFSVFVYNKVYGRAEALFANYIVRNHDNDKLQRAWKQINGLTNATQKAEAIEKLTKLPTGFNGTFGGLRALDYSSATVQDAWIAEGTTNFDDAWKSAGGRAAPGFEVLIALISFIVFIPVLKMAKKEDKRR